MRFHVVINPLGGDTVEVDAARTVIWYHADGRRRAADVCEGWMEASCLLWTFTGSARRLLLTLHSCLRVSKQKSPNLARQLDRSHIKLEFFQDVNWSHDLAY